MRRSNLGDHAFERISLRYRQRRQRSSQQTGGIADGEPDPPSSDIHSEHAHRGCYIRMGMLRRSLAFGVVVLAMMGSVPHGQTPERDRADSLTRRAAERLEALHAEADRLAREERTVLGDLRKLEVERDIRAAELDRARTEVRTATAELAALDEQVTLITTQSKAALPDIEARLVTLYKLGRGQYARLLLSATDLRQFTQAIRLISALAEQDRQRLTEHRHRLDELQAARVRAQARQAEVQRAQAAALDAQVAAEHAISARNALVRDIDTRRDLNAQYAAELQAAQERLQASVADLAATSSLPITPFKGDLDWPVAGEVRQRFGAATGGRPPLRGIEVATDAGTHVHAVHDGTVAFADTFSGYGRLVIVDHGNQTFTLYGNLDDILVEKGAHVDRGTPLGTPALANPATAVLYFELRIDGRAVDPLQWLAKR
ncbi:MAG: peptidoglycan DD-metalloendopeptidase family protein [Vicinamibacterales bacterium]